MSIEWPPSYVKFLQDEMNTVVAGIDRPIRAKRIRQCFDVMLANFDADGDGKLSLFEFSEAMKTMQFWFQGTLDVVKRWEHDQRTFDVWLKKHKL